MTYGGLIVKTIDTSLVQRAPVSQQKAHASLRTLAKGKEMRGHMSHAVEDSELGGASVQCEMGDFI